MKKLSLWTYKAGEYLIKLLGFVGYYLLLLPALFVHFLISFLIRLLSFGLSKDGIVVLGIINSLLLGFIISRALSHIVAVWLSYILGFAISIGVFLLIAMILEEDIVSSSILADLLYFLFIFMLFFLPTLLILVMVVLGLVLGLVLSPFYSILSVLSTVFHRMSNIDKRFAKHSGEFEKFGLVECVWKGKLNAGLSLKTDEICRNHLLAGAITAVLKAVENFEGGEFLWELDKAGKIAVFDVPLNIVRVLRWVFYVVFLLASAVLVPVMYLAFLVAVFVIDIVSKVWNWLFSILLRIAWVLFRVVSAIVSPFIPVRVKTSDYEKGDPRKRILEFISDVLKLIILSYGEEKITGRKAKKILYLRSKIEKFIYYHQDNAGSLDGLGFESNQKGEILSFVLPELKVKTAFSIFDGGMERGVFINSKGLIRKMQKNVELLSNLVDVKIMHRVAEYVVDKTVRECVKDGIKMMDSSFEFIRTLGWIIVMSVAEIFLLDEERNQRGVKSSRVKLMKKISDAVAYKLTNSTILETVFAD